MEIFPLTPPEPLLHTCRLHSRSFSAQPMRLAAAPHGYQRLPHVAVVSFLHGTCKAGSQAGRLVNRR
jgi:hypothetical protein